MESRMRVPVGSGELDVLVSGPVGRGTLITTHAAEPMDRALPVIAEMTGARVACVNPRGVGRSSPPRAPRHATLEGMAADLELVRRALGASRFVFWGMSAGSMIAQIYARLHPEALDGLVLDSAGPCFALTLADPDCMMNPSLPRWAEALAAPRLVPDDEGSRDLSWAALRGTGWVLRNGEGRPLLVSPNEPSAELRRVMPSLLAFDARPWLGDIAVPVLVLGGRDDPVAPVAQLQALHRAIPGSGLAVIEGAGHVPLVKHPDAVASVVRPFLADRAWR